MDQQLRPRVFRARRDILVGWLCVGVLVAVSFCSAVWAVVLLPPITHPTLLPRIAESAVLAGPGLYLSTVYAGRASRSRAGAALVALTWILTVVVLSGGRPEGDNPYLLASFQGLLLAPTGMIAGAVGVAHAYRRPWPAEPPADARVLPDASRGS